MRPEPKSRIISLRRLAALDAFVHGATRILCWANGLLIGVILLQVTLRYGFGQGQIFLEELQWHLFSLAMVFGISFAQVTDSHIRVDVLAAGFSARTRRLLEIFGIVVFILPFVWVVFYHSLDFVAESWRLGERSSAPSGLPWRWAIKAVIPAGFGLLGAVVLAQLARHLVLLRGVSPAPLGVCPTYGDRSEKVGNRGPIYNKPFANSRRKCKYLTRICAKKAPIFRFCG